MSLHQSNDEIEATVPVLHRRRHIDTSPRVVHDGIVARFSRNGDVERADMLARSSMGASLGPLESLSAVVEHDCQSLLIFERRGEIAGGMAFLYLTQAGLTELREGRLSRSHPDIALLAHPDEKPAAIYVWALLARSRASLGLSHITRLFGTPRFRQSDVYAEPVTPDGERTLRIWGYEPDVGAKIPLMISKRLSVTEVV